MFADNNDYQRLSDVCVCGGGGGCVCPMVLFSLRGFMFKSVRYDIILDQFGFARIGNSF